MGVADNWKVSPDIASSRVCPIMLPMARAANLGTALPMRSRLASSLVWVVRRNPRTFRYRERGRPTTRLNFRRNGHAGVSSISRGLPGNSRESG
jgi:hypothetical protein